MSALFILLAGVSLVIALAVGFMFVSVLWGGHDSFYSDFPIKLFLAVGFGFGISSCLDFAWTVVVGRLSRGAFVCELALLAVLCVVYVGRQKSSSSAAPTRPQNISASGSSKPYLLRLALCVAAISAFVRFLYLSIQDPHGKFDAFVTWNFRARFLFRDADQWRLIAAPTEANRDYPLLIPISVARSWVFMGRETQLIPIAIGMLFTFATIGIVAASIIRIRSERQGLLAGLMLLSTPFLISHGTSQYADVPVSFFFVATAALMFLHVESQSRTRYLSLAGAAAALSAWTKNEGVLFLVLLFFLYISMTTVTKGVKVCRNGAAALLAGAALPLAAIVIFKLRIAAGNDLVAAQGFHSTASKLLDFSRYHIVATQFVRGVFTFGGWIPMFTLPILLLFYFLLVGTRVREMYVPIAGLTVILTMLMLVGYFFIYIVTPFDLAWHLETSLTRLLLQLWPLAIFCYFVIVRTPEEAFAGE